jgi:hypothetical protein
MPSPEASGADMRGHCSALLNASQTRLCARRSQTLAKQDTPWRTSVGSSRRVTCHCTMSLRSCSLGLLTPTSHWLIVQMVENVVQHLAERLCAP